MTALTTPNDVADRLLSAPPAPDFGEPAAVAWARNNNWCVQTSTHAAMIGERDAIRFLDTALTWSDLDEQMRAFAAALHRRGVNPGDRVAVLMLNRPEHVVAVLAINYLGAIAVPMNFRLAPPEVAYQLHDSGSTLVITDAILEPLITAIRPGVPAVTGVISADPPATDGHEGFAELLAEPGEPAPLVNLVSELPALIVYTSGTTGRPKGAVLTHGNMEAQSLTCIRAYELNTTDDITFFTSPLFHIAGYGALSANFTLGGTVAMQPLGAFDPEKVLDALEATRATTSFMVPVQWQLLCAAQRANPRKVHLRKLCWGAAPSTDAILRDMSETFPEADNISVFGQTELSPITTVLRGVDAIRKLGSVGQRIPTLRLRIVDENMNDVAQGEVGEAVYLGPTMMAGYWNKPEETAKAFAGGWFHSGDMVREDEEGFIYIVDRKKDMIISGGENIYCAEVENVLGDHPAVREAAIIGRPHPKWGEIPVAYVALVDGPGATLELEELTELFNSRLARYKHPKDLVVIAELPRNAVAKIDKLSIRAMDSEHAAGE